MEMQAKKKSSATTSLTEGKAMPVSFRCDEVKIERLDGVAGALGRNRNWCINEALDNYLELQGWQLAHIDAGIADSDAGRTLSTEQVRENIRTHHQARVAARVDN